MSRRPREPPLWDIHANDQDFRCPFSPLSRPLSPDEGFSHRSDSESNLWAAEYESRMGAGVQQGLGEAPGLFSLKKKRSQIKEAQRPVLCGDDLFFVFFWP